MELIVKGIMDNLYQSKEFTNGKTGNVTPATWYAQFTERKESEQGSQMIIHKIKVPDDKINLYKSKVGDLVEIPVKQWVMNGKAGLSGV